MEDEWDGEEEGRKGGRGARGNETESEVIRDRSIDQDTNQGLITTIFLCNLPKFHKQTQTKCNCGNAKKRAKIIPQSNTQ